MAVGVPAVQLLCWIALFAAHSYAFTPAHRVLIGRVGSQWKNPFVQAGGTPHLASRNDFSSRRSIVTRTLMVWSVMMACTALKTQKFDDASKLHVLA
jgi:hypothetical protein